ncbi:hypothetical protein [Numidum massiliense]|uniref:hypothetical protein n=1 Tax=Numidum massiliense TaxID=1522315 RepID=UPI0011CB6D2B|nr:hypothetical protein [Numidum massiliense]
MPQPVRRRHPPNWRQKLTRPNFPEETELFYMSRLLYMISAAIAFIASVLVFVLAREEKKG